MIPKSFGLALSLLCVVLSIAPSAFAEDCSDDVCTSVPPGYVRGDYDAVSGASPKRTLLLGYAHRSGARLVEWDLDRSRAVRVVPLGGARDTGADVAVTRTAGGVAVVVAEHGATASVHVVLLDASLEITASRRIGRGAHPAIAARGDELFVAWLSTAERVSVVRLDARDGRLRASGEVSLHERATTHPGVSVVASTEGAFVTVHTEQSLFLVGAADGLTAFVSARIDATDGALVMDAGVPHLLFRAREGAIVDSFVQADLTLTEPRTVDQELSSIGLTGAFGPDHTLALPSGLLVPQRGSGSAPVRGPTTHLLVARVVWVGNRVVTLETSWKRPTLVVTRAR